MSITLIAAARAWLKTDASEDANLQLTLDAAESFIGKAVDQTFSAENPPDNLLKVAIFALAGHWLENREAGSPLEIREVPLGVANIIMQKRPVVPA